MSKIEKQLLTQISPLDERDYTTKSLGIELKELPDKYEPEHKLQVFCQHLSYTCVAHAVVTMLQYCEQKKGYTPNNYSRGFIYANRNGEDLNVSGMYSRKAMKILQKEGTCSYYSFRWGQSTLKRTLRKFEPIQEELEKEAQAYTVVDKYYSLNGFEEIKNAVYTNGAAIISIPVYASTMFLHKLNPRKSYDGKRGNHCVAVIGWDGDYLICQDSYSPLRAFNGYFLIHKDYKLNEAWTVILKKEKRPDITPTSTEKYLGYVKYLFEWITGGFEGLFVKMKESIKRKKNHKEGNEQ